jgi:O-antigen/teichoic acid export membrane protein
MKNSSLSRGGTPSEAIVQFSAPKLGRPARGLALQSAVSVVTSLGIQALNILTGVIVARLLGPVGKGELTAVLLWAGLLVTMGGLGVIDGITYFTARAAGQVRQIAATGFFVTTLVSLVLLAMGALIVPRVLSHYGQTAVYAGWLYLAWIPANLLTLAAVAVLQGKLELLAFNKLRFTVVVGTALGIVVLYAAGQVSVVSVVLITLAANLLTLAAAATALALRGWLGYKPDPKLIRPMIIFGLKSHTGAVAGLVNARADQAIISLFLAPAYLGLYSVAVTVASVVGLLASPLAIVAFPAVASAQSESDMQDKFARFVRATFVLSTLVASASFVAIPTLIKLFFGPAFLPAAGVTQILLFGTVVLTTGRVMGEGLKGFNHPLVPGIAEILAAGVTLVALAALLPSLGLMGAALASVLAYLTSLSYMLWFSNRRLGISLLKLLVPSRSDLSWARGQLSKSWRRARG